MTTKTPSGLAAGSDDETIDDSLDEILLHANERSMDRPIDSGLGGGLPRLQLPRPNTATLLGVQASSLPLPGSAASLAASAASPFSGAHAGADLENDLPELTPTVLPRSDEVTQIARSSLLDEPPEESTNVEPPEITQPGAPAPASILDELDVALTEQASTEREKALRKSFPGAARGAEFDDPEDSAASAAHDTPASLTVDAGDDESTANGRGPLSGSGAGAPTLSLGTSRMPPSGNPLGRSEPFGARLPAPTITGFAAPSLSPNFGVPSPSSTPGLPTTTPAYGSPAVSAYAPPASSSAFGGTRASSPAVPIPAPLGAPASVRRSSVFNKVQLPVGGLVAFLIAAFSLGLIVGAWLWRGAITEVPVIVTAPAPTPPPIVAPTAPAPPAAAAEPTAAQVVPGGSTAAVYEGEVVPTPPTAAAPEPTLVAPSPQPARPARPARKPAAPTAAADPFAAEGSTSTATATPAKASRPKKTTGTSGSKRDVDSRGVAKGWVDPFAQ